MATIPEILSRKWPGMTWSIQGDDYATLAWRNAQPKPAEADIRALSSVVDAEIAAETAAKAQQDKFIAVPDALLQAMENVVLLCDFLRNNLQPAALKSVPPPATLAAWDAFVQRVKTARQ
jgi:hypothetical protein